MNGMGKIEVIASAAVVAVVVGTIALAYHAIETRPTLPAVACTMEAKQCPDGSYVGRQGPACEFAPCPGEGAATSDTSAVSSGGADSSVGLDGSAGAGIAPYQSGMPAEGSAQAGIRGTVMLGPTCAGPERVPPDPDCADKPYVTTVTVSRAGAGSVLATAQSDSRGRFEFSLPPGEYTVTAKGGDVLPSCGTVEITVGPSGYGTADISCDTGIR